MFEDATRETLLDRQRDVLAAELAHRIKNSLQVISSFVAYELRQAADPCLDGYRAMQARISAVAELYDVIARSSAFGPVEVDAYLEGIASSIRSSLLGEGSRIEIAVEAEPLTIIADHAVSLGLMVNELATNAIKYAFPRRRRVHQARIPAAGWRGHANRRRQRRRLGWERQLPPAWDRGSSTLSRCSLGVRSPRHRRGARNDLHRPASCNYSCRKCGPRLTAT